MGRFTLWTDLLLYHIVTHYQFILMIIYLIDFDMFQISNFHKGDACHEIEVSGELLYASFHIDLLN